MNKFSRTIALVLTVVFVAVIAGCGGGGSSTSGGKTFDDSFVILDEAQNTTPRQMKMFLTRIGRDTKVVVNGDVEQSDLNEYSGLEDAVRVLRGLPGAQLVQFTVDDVVRSDIVGRIIRAYAEAPSLRRPGR